MSATHVKVSKHLLRELLALTKALALIAENTIAEVAGVADSDVDEVRFSGLALRDAIDELEALLV